MNPELPQQPQDELEVWLTALLLGELPHAEAAALHQKLAQDAELAKVYERLKHTVNLVRETITSPAAQTAGQPAPLKLSDQRRAKLLQHFKTVAPKEFARPRHSALRWLVPVGIAAALVALVVATILPNFVTARSSHRASLFRTWSLSDSAAPAPPSAVVTASSSEDARLALSYTKRIASAKPMPRQAGETRVQAPVPARAQSAGSAIVLPKAVEFADATTTPPALEGENTWSASAANRGFYDDSQGQVGGAGRSGGSSGKTITAGAVEEGRQMGFVATDSFFSQPKVKDTLESAEAVAAWQDNVQSKQGNVGFVDGSTPGLSRSRLQDALKNSGAPASAPAGDLDAGTMERFGAVPPPVTVQPLVAPALAEAARSDSFNKPPDTTSSAVALQGLTSTPGPERSLMESAIAPAAPLAAPAPPQEEKSKSLLTSGLRSYPSQSTFGGGAYGGYSLAQEVPSLKGRGEAQGRPALRSPKEGGVSGGSGGALATTAPSRPQEPAAKALGFDWYLGDVVKNQSAIKAQGGTAPAEHAGEVAGISDSRVAAADTVSPYYRLRSGASAQPSAANSDADKIPMVVGDVPAMGALFRTAPGGNADSFNANLGAPATPQSAAGREVGAGGVVYNYLGVATNYVNAGTFGLAPAPTTPPPPASLNGSVDQSTEWKFGSGNANVASLGRTFPSNTATGDAYFSLDPENRRVANIADGATTAHRETVNTLALQNGAPADVEASLQDLFKRNSAARDAHSIQDNGLAKESSASNASTSQGDTGQYYSGVTKNDVGGLRYLPPKDGDKVKSVEWAYEEGRELKQSAAASEKPSQQSREPHTVNVVGFYNVPSTVTNAVAAAPAKTASYDRFTHNRVLSQLGTDAKSPARVAGSPIVLPQGQPETGMALNDGSGKGVKLYAAAQQIDAALAGPEDTRKPGTAESARTQPYFEAKRDLEELQRFRQILDMKIASEKIDEDLPKTMSVEIVNKAVAEPAQGPTLGERLRGAFGGKVERSARVKVARDQSDVAGLAEQGQAKAYDPYFVQSEEEVIQSEAVLGKVAEDLDLKDAWAKKGTGEKLTTAEAVQLLKESLDLHPAQNTSLLEIGVKSDKPEEAARIANAVAEAYKARRLEQRTQLSTAGTKALEDRYAQQTAKVIEAQKKVDDLRVKLQIPDAVAVGEGPVTDAAAPKPAASAPIPQPEVQTAENAFSTFSLNVSDVSFKLAGASLEKGLMPEPANVRSEEFINAFDYRDPEPPPGVPVAFAWERAQYPFAQNRDLLRFSIKTAAQGRQPGRPLNLVLLLDNSGSMERADRVRIIHEALCVLAGQLQAQDVFSVVTFSRTARLFADGAPGNDAEAVAMALTELTPQGGTNLEDAMNLAYQTALRHYLANGVNRVVLLTDGAANLGNVDPEALKQKVEANRKQGVALDCFGIGWEGYNDDLLEVLSRNGDGRYAFLNSPEEVADEFAAKLAGALQVAASDVKVQVEFNPARVTAYRQIGYAKHQLTKEQFRDNTVNAAQIGAAEAGNALYTVEVNPNGTGPLGTVRVRFRIPGTADYREHAWDVPFTGNAVALEQASPAMRLAATASAFSEWLASSPYAGEVTPDRLLGYLSGVPEVYGADARPKKLEWMIRQAQSIAGK